MGICKPRGARSGFALPFTGIQRLPYLYFKDFGPPDLLFNYGTYSGERCSRSISFISRDLSRSSYSRMIPAVRAVHTSRKTRTLGERNYGWTYDGFLRWLLADGAFSLKYSYKVVDDGLVILRLRGESSDPSVFLLQEKIAQRWLDGGQNTAIAATGAATPGDTAVPPPTLNVL